MADIGHSSAIGTGEIGFREVTIVESSFVKDLEYVETRNV